MENKVGDTVCLIHSPPKQHRNGAEVRAVLIPIKLCFEQNARIMYHYIDKKNSLNSR